MATRQTSTEEPRAPRCAQIIGPVPAAAESALWMWDRRPLPEASALLPMLHLVQSVDGYVTPEGSRVRRDPRHHPRRGRCGRDVLHDVQAPPGRRVPRRRVHEHAVRGHGRRRNLPTAEEASRRRERRDHRGRHDHPGAHRVQRRLRLCAGGDGELGVLRQPDAGVRGHLVDDLRPGSRSPRPAVHASHGWRAAERVLAGFSDGRANEGPAAGPRPGRPRARP